jgi:hypothetical protein
MAASYTFKIASGGEFRRMTVASSTTLAALKDSVFGEGEAPLSKLSYFDDEGDRILLATEADLVECFSFLEASGTKVLRLQVEKPSPPPEYLPSPASSGLLRPTQGGMVPPKALEKLEKIDCKIAKKNAKCARKLARLMQSPSFNHAEFEAKRRAVEEAGIPLLPVVELMIAKRMLHRGGCGWGHGGGCNKGRAWKRWWSMESLGGDSESGSNSDGEGGDLAPFPRDEKQQPHAHPHHHGPHQGPRQGHGHHPHHGPITATFASITATTARTTMSCLGRNPGAGSSSAG